MYHLLQAQLIQLTLLAVPLVVVTGVTPSLATFVPGEGCSEASRGDAFGRLPAALGPLPAASAMGNV